MWLERLLDPADALVTATWEITEHKLSTRQLHIPCNDVSFVSIKLKGKLSAINRTVTVPSQLINYRVFRVLSYMSIAYAVSIVMV